VYDNGTFTKPIRDRLPSLSLHVNNGARQSQPYFAVI